MAYQPQESLNKGIANFSCETGSIALSATTSGQIVSSTIPSNAISAIITSRSHTSPDDPANVYAISNGYCYIDFSSNLATGIWAGWGYHIEDNNLFNATINQGNTLYLIASAYTHAVRIENYGGGPGGSLNIFASDISIADTAVSSATIEYILP